MPGKKFQLILKSFAPFEMFHICFIDKDAHKSLGEPNLFPEAQRMFCTSGLPKQISAEGTIFS